MYVIGLLFVVLCKQKLKYNTGQLSPPFVCYQVNGQQSCSAGVHSC